MIKEWKYGERKMTIKITPDKTGIFLLPINYVDGTSCIFSFLDLGVSFFFFIEGRSAA